jgi:hypothetical protein
MRLVSADSGLVELVLLLGFGGQGVEELPGIGGGWGLRRGGLRLASRWVRVGRFPGISPALLRRVGLVVDFLQLVDGNPGVYLGGFELGVA